MSLSTNADTLKNLLVKLAPTLFLVAGTILSIYLATGQHRLSPPSIRLDSQLLESVTLFPLEGLLSEDPSSSSPIYAEVRDPFLVPNVSVDGQEVLPELQLSMIIINKRHRMCKVNGKLYFEGDRGPDFQVKIIEEDKVLVERRGRGQWLFLAQNG